MTIISEASTDLTNVLNYLEKYEKALSEAPSLFELEGKKLEHINRTLPGYLARYDEMYNELKVLEEFLEKKKEIIMSPLWKKYNEKYSRQLSQRDIQAYIAGEPEIVSITELILEVKLLKEQFSSVVKALEQMGWSLKNIVELRIHELQDAIL
jgi:hypothetical protein